MNRNQENRLRLRLHHLMLAKEQHVKEQQRFPNQPTPSTEYALTQAVEDVVEFVRKLVKDG